LPLTDAVKLYSQMFNLPFNKTGLPLPPDRAPRDPVPEIEGLDPTALEQWLLGDSPTRPPAPTPTGALEHAAGPPHQGTLNGTLDVSAAGDPQFGGTVHGAAAVANGSAVLGEDVAEQTGFAQVFVIPAGTTALRFTLTGLDLRANGTDSSPDAFEAALLDA